MAFWNADVCGILVLGCKQLLLFFTLEQRLYSLVPKDKGSCFLRNVVLDIRLYSARQRCILAAVACARTALQT